jgi:hypothetical protein
MESECNQNDSTMKPEPDPPDLLSYKDDKIMNLLVARSSESDPSESSRSSRATHSK